ncbi:hypothetical protein BJX61DRAFT_158129 [Aspergillus egyptiacus]|nr:hypothetical protein BJX61DRAFT_158129 [Aspergillus egyptiacus]
MSVLLLNAAEDPVLMCMTGSGAVITLSALKPELCQNSDTESKLYIYSGREAGLKCTAIVGFLALTYPTLFNAYPILVVPPLPHLLDIQWISSSSHFIKIILHSLRSFKDTKHAETTAIDSPAPSGDRATSRRLSERIAIDRWIVRSIIE